MSPIRPRLLMITGCLFAGMLLAAVAALASSEVGPPGGMVEGPHGEIPGFPANSCAVCHEIAWAEIGATSNWEAVKVPNEVCLGCHTDGPTFGTNDPQFEPRPNATPAGNHASVVTGSTRFTYGDFGALWWSVDHIRGLHCTSCHDPHRTFAGPGSSTNNVKYVRDHTDDWRVEGGNRGFLRWRSYQDLKVIDNTGPAPVEVLKQVDQAIVYTGVADLADGVGLGAAEADVCEVCHTLTDHHQADGTAPGGQSHFDGEDCTACHTHASGFAPSGGGQPLTGPHAAFGDPDCGSCHGSTYFPGGPDNPTGSASLFCATCHGPTDTAYAENHSHLVTGSGKFEYTIECTACHDQHGWAIANVDGNDNLRYVKARLTEEIVVVDNTAGGIPITKTIDSDIVFDSLDDFANGDSLYTRDICVTCHTLTAHHQNDGDAPGGQSHFDGEVCTSCHQHAEGFRPPGGLSGPPVQGPHGAIPGYAEQDCLACHDQHGWDITNVDGNLNLDYVKATISEQITVVDKTQVPPVQVDKTIDSAIVFDSLDDFANGDALYDRDICVTCHTLTNHHQNDGDAPGGQSHRDGEDCTSCHQHPEGFRPPGGLAGPPVQGPHAAIPGFPGGDCLVCHDLYATVDEMKANATEVCLSCHSDGWTIVPATPEHVHSSPVTGTARFDYNVECAACHAPHGWQAEIENAQGTSNIKYVRANIDELITVIDNTVDPPATVIKEIDNAITFTATSGDGSFADGDANYTEDVCNTCHTLTNHHQNDGTAPGGQSHFDGQACTSCHLHPEGFGGFGGPHVQADSDCANCHLGADGEPDLVGIHGSDCATCHPTDLSSTILGPVGTWNMECSECHNPFVAETGFMDQPTKGHRCVACHGQQRGTQDSQDIHKRHAPEANCVVCHGFVPDIGVVIGSGNRDSCVVCHSGGASGKITSIHRRHTDQGLSCLECHGGTRPPVDVVDGPPVGGAANVCKICHSNRDPSDFAGDPEKRHKRHTEERLDCGSCHSAANLQDDRVPMPAYDDPVRAMLDRTGFGECSHCHEGGESADSETVHEKHVAGQWQWCYNCHLPDDGRPVGDEPPVTEPSQACVLCHGGGEQYGDGTPFDIHERHSGRVKCYACHQATPRIGDWPRSWLGGVD